MLAVAKAGRLTRFEMFELDAALARFEALRPADGRVPALSFSTTVCVMPLDAEDLKRRLERAAQLRLRLRRATRELREMGREALGARRDGTRRPDHRRPARG